jgi:uncharacterized DUF497 family protein
MAVPTFEWNPQKVVANLNRHGVAFEEALTIFQGPLAKIHADPDHSVVEPRESLVGHSLAGRLLLVAFTERGSRIRLINARRATWREGRDYEERIGLPSERSTASGPSTGSITQGLRAIASPAG